MIKRTILLTTVFATLLSATLSVQAQDSDYYWTGARDNTYYFAANWNVNGAPYDPEAQVNPYTGLSDKYLDLLSNPSFSKVCHILTTSGTVTVDFSTLGVASLTVGNGIGGETGTATLNRGGGLDVLTVLTVNKGAEFTVGGAVTVSGRNNVPGRLTVNGGTFNANNTTTINAGGELTVNGGTYNPTGMTISGTFNYNSGNNLVNGNTITLNDGGVLNISGNGQFRISGGSAALNITGGTATISSISYIGVTANGVINQSGGNATFSNALVFGWGAGNGTYNLSNGTLTTESFAGLWCAKSSGFNTFNVTGGTANFGKTGNSFEVGLYNDGTNYTWTPQSVANVFNLNSGTVNAADTFAVQYGGTLNVAQTAENTLGDGVLNAKAITLTNTGNLNMSSGTINVGEGGIKSSDGAYSITLSGGTFGTNGASWSSALNAAISANTVTFAPETDKTITWSGVLSGAGGVTKSGDGTLTLAGANTYSGTTTNSGGALKLTGDGSLGTGAVVNEASLVFAHDSEQTFTNAVSGTGTVTKTGEGRLKINAANGFQASSLIVEAGRLDFKGTLTGGGITLSENTVFSPGNSVGMAAVGGDFTLSSNSSILMEIGGSDTAQNDGLDVSGELKLNEGLIYLQMADTFNLTSGTRFYALLNGSNSGVLSDEDFIEKYVRAYGGFTELEYVKMTEGDYAGKYAITGVFDANAIPEPSTWLLLLFGTFGLLYWRKK